MNVPRLFHSHVHCTPQHKLQEYLEMEILQQPLLLVLVCTVVFSALPMMRADYTAAVVEHKALSWLLPFINKPQAQGISSLNLDIFDYQVSVAVSKGADIIVFPEYGVTGFVREERDYVLPFLETVPDPLALQPKRFIPCHEKTVANIPIQYRLSCIALKYNITVVANLMTVYPCDGVDDQGCPPDGRYQYNTDVAFAGSGELLARYHKENLYSGEAKVFNAGQNQAEVATFRTSFGYFGLFTCFDLLFQEPADRLVTKLGVDTMVFPTAWMNQLPLLSAAEYQQAWSLSYGVNILAANQHYPIAQMTGSGIYSPITGAVTYIYDMSSILGKMVIGRVNSTANRRNHGNAVNKKSASVRDSPLIKHMDPAGLSGGINSSLLSGIHKDLPNHKSVINHHDNKTNQRGKKQERTSQAGVPQFFTSEMNDDPYNFTLLVGKTGHVSVSNNNIRCSLNFSRESDSEMYALGAFDGLHTMNGQYYVQCCGLVRCGSNTDPYKCGAEVSAASTLFQSFRLTIAGQSDQTRLFPEVLTSGVRLPPMRTEWDFSEQRDVLGSVGSLKEPLLTANIFGRWYQRD